LLKQSAFVSIPHRFNSNHLGGNKIKKCIEVSIPHRFNSNMALAKVIPEEDLFQSLTGSIQTMPCPCELRACFGVSIPHRFNSNRKVSYSL